jgi:hypothetical protein
MHRTGDTAFGLTARIFSTALGGLLGMVMWYIAQYSSHRPDFLTLSQVYLLGLREWEPVRASGRLCCLLPVLFLRTTVLARGSDETDDLFRHRDSRSFISRKTISNFMSA